MRYKLIIQSIKNGKVEVYSKNNSTIDEALYWADKHIGHTIPRRNIISIQIIREDD